jgi:type I restriction enzyme S subunit
MEVAMQHKDTELGTIPDDWEIRYLGDLGNVVRGGSPRPAGDPRFFNGDYIPWLTVAALTNLSESQLHVTETAGHLTKEGAERSRVLEPDTLIIANSGATLGVAKILDVKCCANDGIAAIINQNAGDKRFIAYCINSQTERLRKVVATGNGQPNLNTGLIRNIPVPFPPRPEQRAIADALSDVDALIEQLEALIAKKHAIKTATMQQLLTGQQRLPGFSAPWTTKPFDDLFQRVNPGVRQLKADEYSTSGSYPVIDQGKKPIAGYSDREDKVYFCPSDGVIVFGDHTRIRKFINFDFIIGADGTQILSTRSGLHLKFFYYQLLRKEIPNTGYNRHFKFLKEMTFEVPPTEEQQAIATILTDMDAEIEALQARRDKTQAIKQGMMQELLTGRTRLV